jgi:hypothetical protein
VKGRAERIASITDSWNFATTFAQDRIVHGDHQGLPWAQALLGASADLAKEFGRLNALVRIEAVIGAPVSMKLPIGG